MIPIRTLAVLIVALGSFAFAGDARPVRAVDLDYGDAPSSYGTAAAGGTAPILGNTVDTEGAPTFTSSADGDDLAGSDDEDGVVQVGEAVPCSMITIRVTVSGGSAFIRASFDWNRDGVFGAWPESANSHYGVNPGQHYLPWLVACDATPGSVIARIRVSGSQIPGDTGATADGEVEDHLVVVSPATGNDHGDAPASYGVASHGNSGPYFGPARDSEPSQQFSADALGDDNNGDDEGLALFGPLTQCGTRLEGSNIEVQPGAVVNAWGDWNHDGDFDADEHAIVNVFNPGQEVGYTHITVPCRAGAGPVFIRLRTTTGPPIAWPSPTGHLTDGEVEDLLLGVHSAVLSFAVPGSSVSGTALAPTTGTPGELCVDLRDASGPLFSVGDPPVVTLSLASGSGTLSCTGGLKRVLAYPPAVFSGCAIHGTGTFRIRASAPFLADVISAPIVVSEAPAQHGYLRALAAPSVPTTITVNGVRRDTWATTWLKLPVGIYEVAFTDVPGFETPAPQLITIAAGGTATVTGTFAQSGVLRVETSPPVPAAVTVNSFLGADDWGLFTYITPGQYYVCFGPVVGFTAPPCQGIAVNSGAQTTVTGVYSPNPEGPAPMPNYGYLRAFPAPALPAVLKARDPYSQHLRLLNTWATTWSKQQANPGLVLVASDVPGFTTPPPQPVLILPGQTSEVPLAFGVDGILRVETSPPVPGTIAVDGIPRNDWGVFTWLPAATYTVCFGPVPGYTAPPCQPATLTPGNQATIVGTYTPN